MDASSHANQSLSKWSVWCAPRLCSIIGCPLDHCGPVSVTFLSPKDEIVVDKQKTGWEWRRIPNDIKIITVWGLIQSEHKWTRMHLSLRQPKAPYVMERRCAHGQEPAVRGCCWTDVPKCLMVLHQVADWNRSNWIKVNVRCGHESSIRTRNWIFAVSGVRLISSVQVTARNHWMGARHAWWHVCVLNGVHVGSASIQSLPNTRSYKIG